ncbi:MAG: hypothetical protein ACJAU9_001089 [Lentimonas sp.]|jgi:hypothetical protein
MQPDVNKLFRSRKGVMHRASLDAAIDKIRMDA